MRFPPASDPRFGIPKGGCPFARGMDGAPLPSGTPPPPPPPSDPVVGEINRAFQMTLGFGPVRLIFTRQRILAYNDGEYRTLPSASLYRQWKSALPTGQNWRVTSVPSLPFTTPPLWNIEVEGVLAARSRRPWGIGADADAASLTLAVRPDRVVAGPGGPDEFYFARPRMPLVLTFHVVGDPASLLDFLKQMPIGPVASDSRVLWAGVTQG